MESRATKELLALERHYHTLLHAKLLSYGRPAFSVRVIHHPCNCRYILRDLQSPFYKLALVTLRPFAGFRREKLEAVM